MTTDLEMFEKHELLSRQELLEKIAKLEAEKADMLNELQYVYARHGYQSTADVIRRVTGA